MQSTEGLVDYYMECNWNDQAYRAHFERIGGVPVRTGKPRLPVPPQASAGASAAANLVAGVAGGLIDAVIWNGLKAVPLLGIGPMYLDAVKAARDAFKNEAATDDQGNLSEVILSMGLLRTAADFIGGAAANIADTITLLQDAGLLLAAVSGGFSALLELLLPIGEVCRGVSAGTELIKTLLDGAMLIGNVFLSRRLEAEGNKRGADKALELASGNALDLIMDGFATVAAFAELATLNHAGGGEILTDTLSDAMENTGEATLRSAMKAVAREGVARAAKKGISSINPIAGAPGLKSGASGAAKTAARVVKGANTAKRIVGHGKNIAKAAGLNGNPGGAETVGASRTLSGQGPVAVALAPVRQKTLQSLQAANEELGQAQPILWHQKLIDDFSQQYSIGNFASDALDWATSPSAWLRSYIASLPFSSQIANWILEQGRDNPEVLAGALRAIVPYSGVVEPVLQQVGQWIGDHRDDIQNMSQEVADLVAEHQVTLQVFRDAISSGQELLTSISSVADEHGTVDGMVDSLIGQLERLKINGFQVPPITGDLIRRVSRHIPGLAGIAGRIGGALVDHIPGMGALLEQARRIIQRAVDEAIRRWNTQVDEYIASARTMADEKLAEIDAWIDDKTALVTGWLAELEAELADGGQIQQLLQAQYAKVQQLVAQANQAIQDWDGTLDLDFGSAATWLVAVAQALLDHVDASRGQDEEELIRQWTEVLQGEATPWVRDFKQQHSDAVELACYPPVPAEEVAAALQSVGGVRQRIDAWAERLPADSPHQNVVQRYRTQLASIQSAISGARGRRGEGALQSLWSAEDRLIALDNQVASQASSGAGS